MIPKARLIAQRSSSSEIAGTGFSCTDNVGGTTWKVRRGKKTIETDLNRLSIDDFLHEYAIDWSLPGEDGENRKT
jgi:hypothetical protein